MNMGMTPIVLHHGLFGHGHMKWGPLEWSYFKGIDRAIGARGYPLIITNVHPTAAVATRARQLKEMILTRLDEMDRHGEKVVILAHSLGGLDARYMLTHLGMGSHVKALVTISTPHRGSTYADWCVRHIGNRLGVLRLMKLLGVDMQAIMDVTRSGCREFNKMTPDLPRVKYYSISSQRPRSQMPPFARHSHKVIEIAEGKNDGLVSVESARWGEHLETWTLDHWLCINRRLVPRAARSDRIIGHWLKIVDRLVEDGLLEKSVTIRRS
jgi:triacylglycerol lipase